MILLQAAGLPDILEIMLEKAALFPTPHSAATLKGRSTLSQFGQTLVACLTSSKSESRASAESLLRACVTNGVFSTSDLNKVASKLLPAEQRKVRPVLESLGPSTAESSTSRTRSATPTGRPSGRQTPSGRQSLSGRQTPSGRQSVSGRRTPSVSRSQRSGASSTVRSRSVSRNGRQPLDIDVQELISDPNFNPLNSTTGSSTSKRQRMSKQRDHVPEYPEESTHIDILWALKKTWSPLLPSETVQVLFPKDGFQKQDDAIDGCVLLSHAITFLSKNGEQDVFMEQVDLVIRWVSIALSSRDATSGLDSLLLFLNDMFTFLHDERYQFADSESAMLLPYILEKSGSAKVNKERCFLIPICFILYSINISVSFKQGRFRDKLSDLVSFITEGDLYALTKYGPLNCIPVIENTVNSKTRGIVIKELRICVESCGLNGIGKKGLQVQAKSFSDEKMIENKGFHLDLIQTIISKMNGDANRYFKNCGSTNLSKKAKDMILERMAKAASTNEVQDELKPVRESNKIRPSSIGGRPFGSSNASTNQSEEVPALDLNSEKNGTDGPFKFSFGTAESSSVPRAASPLSIAGLSQTSTQRESSSGAAANLRERLRSIRDKHKQEGDSALNVLNVPDSQVAPCPLYNNITETVEILLAEPTPLLDMDDKFTKALVCLRQLHSSLSHNGNDSTGTDPALLKDLRQHLHSNVPACVKLLTRVLEFGFRCGTPSNRNALSVPLLSVSIAGLMAIFLDAKFASNVTPQSLSLVIYQGTASLLDKRLSATATQESSGLDSSTSKKMVKAINKVSHRLISRHLASVH